MQIATIMERTAVFASVVLVIASWGSSSVQGQIRIWLKTNGEEDDSLEDYYDEKMFAYSFANVPSGGIEGHLRLPNLESACTYVDHVPTDSSEDTLWIALVNKYVGCPQEVVTYVRNAGYGLIIASGSLSKNSSRRITNEISNTLFPVVIVTEEYAKYLKDKAVFITNQDAVTVHVEGDILLSVFVSTISFIVGLCCYFCCCCCCIFVNYRSQMEAHWRRLRRFGSARQRNNTRPLQEVERLGREELTESIRRQLQELQLEHSQLAPVGRERAQKLLKRKFHESSDACSACAICVDDFVEGETVRALPCGHIFHPQCIDEWLVHHSSVCPLCKKSVLCVRNMSRSASTLSVSIQVNVPPEVESSTGSDNEPLLRTNLNGCPSYGSV